MPHHATARSRGFTLVELVVVVVLLTFLTFSASSFVTVVGASARSHAVAEDLTLVALMLRLAGLAVLLFGGGFWYLVELHEPGRLDRFRLGHFLLLALTHSLFFAVFAVLGSREVDAWLAVGIAAAVSYPLLVLHVATIVDLRFALVSALPLAVLSTGLVVNGVYGGAAQPFVYLGCACGVIAHLTLTYPRLARGHEARREALARELAAACDALAPAAASGRAAVAAAQGLLALQDPVEHAALRTWVEKRIATLGRRLDDHEHLAALHEMARSASSRAERRTARAGGMQLAARLAGQLPHAGAALREACDTLRQQRSHGAPSLGDDREPAGEHCLACGHACRDDSRFCAACGTRCAEVRRCRRCAQVLRLPVHLLVPAGAEPPPPTHCFACGERHGA